jgi:hypothetical protein
MQKYWALFDATRAGNLCLLAVVLRWRLILLSGWIAVKAARAWLRVNLLLPARSGKKSVMMAEAPGSINPDRMI